MAGPERRVTLLTIANELGVSRTTVSNAYSRPDQLTKELRDRILETAARLGYHGPSPAGRLLRTGRVGTIGLVFTDDLAFVFADPSTTLFMRGVAEATSQAGLGLTLLPVPKDLAPDDLGLLAVPVDGYIVFSIADAHPVFESLLAREVPLVVVDEPEPAGRCSFVFVDDRAGAHQIAEHVAELGHRRVAVIAHRLSDTPSLREVTAAEALASPVHVARERMAGYLAGFRGVAEITTVWEAGDLTVDAGREAAAALHVAHPDVTALMCMTDQLAIGACQALAQAGVDVPGQVSVAGYDDIPRAATVAPPLTTVRQPLVDKGRVSAAMLLRQLEDGPGDRAERVELPIELVLRKSAAHAPA